MMWMKILPEMRWTALMGAALLVVCGESRGAMQDAAAGAEPVQAPPLLLGHDHDTGAHLEANLRERTRDWTLEIQPGVWFAAPRGDLRLPGGRTSQIEDLNFDEVSAAPTLDARLRIGNWQVEARAAFFSADDDVRSSTAADFGAFVIADGDRINADLESTSVQLRVGRRVWSADLTDATASPIGEGIRAPERGVNIDLELFGGVRVNHYDIEITALSGGAAGQSTGADETWVQPTVGLGLRIDFENRITIDVTGDVGVWSDSFSADITATVGYAWTNNIQTDIGYRYAHNSFDGGSDDLEISGSIAGLFAGLTIRF